MARQKKPETTPEFEPVADWTLRLEVAKYPAEDGSTHLHHRVIVKAPDGGEEIFPAPTAEEALFTAGTRLRPPEA